MSDKLLNVRVITRAKKNEVIDLGNNNLKVKLTVPPARGKANKKLIELLANYFGTSKSCIEIISGVKNKSKVVKIVGENKQCRF